LEIRKTQRKDLEAIMDIYAKARVLMEKNGNPTQWKDWYPPREMIEGDIEDGLGYVCEEDGAILGVFYFNIQRDPTYDVIEGAWLDGPQKETCGVVHRIAVKEGTKGVGAFCIRWCLEKCGNLKIDTHADNEPMKGLLKKLGFRYCGIIWVLDGTEERVAYQKINVA
jgi:RimJ/RimL family protein N-acetyltransferase